MPEVQGQISSNAEEILRRFYKLPKAVQTGVVNGVKGALLVLQSRVLTASQVKWRRGSAGLGGRLTSFARVTGDGVADLDAAIGFRKSRGFPYELSQEYGAKAAAGKAMAIPVTDAARRAGSPRKFPGKLALIKGTRNAVLVSVAKSVTSLAGFRAGGDIQYVLVKSIPARLNFRKTVLAGMPFISEEIVKAERKAWAAI